MQVQQEACEVVAPLRKRLQEIVERESATQLQPSCLVDGSVAPPTFAFPEAVSTSDASTAAQQAPPGPRRQPLWVYIAGAVAVVFLILVLGFKLCKRGPSSPSGNSLERKTKQALEDDEYDEPTVRKPRPRRPPVSAESETEDEEDDSDPLFQPLVK